jgi:RHS repeat-associated protein
LVDNLGSTNVILNALGEVEQRLEFDPWGMRVAGPNVGVVNSITNKGYTGHEMDDEVGLINMNARIYDPYLGRFLSADPVLPDAGDMQAFNRYSYVTNNPLKYTDPTGHKKKEHVDGGDGQKPLEQVTVTEAAISPPLANGARQDDFIDVGGSRGESLYRLDGVIYNEEDLLARLVELRDEHNQNRVDEAREDANDPHAGASRIATARRDQARGDYNRLRDSALDRFLDDYGLLLNDDGYITLAEALFNSREDGPNETLSQNLSVLRGAVLTDSKGNPYLQVHLSTPLDYMVHGRIPLQPNSDGTLSARNGAGTRYNFEHDPNGGHLRNFATFVGGGLRYSEVGFDVNYFGSIRDTRNEIAPRI